MSVSKKLRQYRGWIALAALLIVAVAAYAVTQRSASEEPTTRYTTEQAVVGTLSVTVSGTGNVAVDGTTDVYPTASGTVASVKVKKGDTVKKGAVLFTLDSSDAKANTAKSLASYRQAQQGVAQAEAQVIKAANTLEDLEDLREEQESGTAITASTTGGATQTTNEVTDADIESAEADVSSAKASLASAQASRSSAYLSYKDVAAAEDDLSVTAPVSGVIWSLDIEDGDTVSTQSASGSSSSSASSSSMNDTGSSSSAPVVIAPKQPLAVLLSVNEVDLPALAVDQRAEITFDALPDVTATGKVTEIADEGAVNSGVVTYDVWLSIDVADAALRTSMSAAATIVTDIARDAVLVSNAAVKSDSDGTSYVLVLEQGATEPTKVTVEVGLSSSTQTQILSGIDEGATVVTQSSSSSSDSDSSSQGGGFMVPGMGGGGPRD